MAASHYLQIDVGPKIPPNAEMAAQTSRRLEMAVHAVHRWNSADGRDPGAIIAIDLPDMRSGQVFEGGAIIGKSLGARLRAFGPEDALFRLQLEMMKQKGLTVTDGCTYLDPRRCRPATRHVMVARHRDKLATDASIARKKADLIAAIAAGKSKMPLERVDDLVAEWQGHKGRDRIHPHLDFLSKTGNPYRITLTRSLAEAQVSGAYSSYGLSKDGSTVPAF